MNRTHSSYFRHGNVDDLFRLQARAAENNDAVAVTDHEGTIVYVNPTFEALTGYSSNEAIGKTHALIKSGAHSQPFYAKLWAALREGREFCSVFVNRRKNGDLYHEEKTIRPFIDAHGDVTHFVAVGRDVSNTISAVKRMEYLATHDILTNLPNRALFKDRLSREFAQAKRLGGGFALCFLDVDKLKPVNDLYGHSAGDLLLRVVAGVLKGSTREIDTAARLGGDEFALILAGVSQQEDAQEVIAKIFTSLRNGAASKDCRFPPSISIGACLYPRDGLDEHALLVCADQAMYRAKAEGGDSYRFFDGRLDGSNVSHLGASFLAEEGNGHHLPCLDPAIFLWPKLAPVGIYLDAVDPGES